LPDGTTPQIEKVNDHQNNAYHWVFCPRRSGSHPSCRFSRGKYNENSRRGRFPHFGREEERERKKKSQESQEGVKATARYGHWDSTGTELGVVIYNEGSTTLHIQSVACHYIPSDGVKEELIFSNLNYACTELLEPKHTAKFHCDSFKEVVLKQISTLSKENVWITINSYQGEIYRVGGEEIIKVLNSPPTTQFG
jgi:hypothetical protein